MNELLQLAESHKYDSKLICWIAELRPGLFALYHHARVLVVTEDIDELIDSYRHRPEWTPKARPPRANGTRRAGKISARGSVSAEQKAANTAALLALMKGAK